MRKMFHVTYDIVTPESAEHGEAAEMGFVLPGNWHIELAAAVCGEPAGRVKDDCAISLREAIALVSCCFDSGSDGFTYYEADCRENYRDGSEERRALHLPRNATAASAARVSRLLNGRR